MKKIQSLVDNIDEEIEGAKCYAEKYLELKATGDSNWSAKFKQMSSEELNHAGIIHDLAVKEIDQLKQAFTLPVEMENVWTMAHREYVERVAWIKQMLAL